MADVCIEGEDLVVHLTALEKVEAVRGDLRVPLAAVRWVEVLEEPIQAVRGRRAPGTGGPGLVAVGAFRAGRRKTFAAIHHRARRGVRVVLEGAEFDTLIVGGDDPEALAARLRTARPPTLVRAPAAAGRA